jgi:AMP-binding enzyme C-terminal domain
LKGFLSLGNFFALARNISILGILALGMKLGIQKPWARRGRRLFAWGYRCAALSGFCRERLAGYKCPVEIRVVEELPKTATGKITRNTLRDEIRGR